MKMSLRKLRGVVAVEKHERSNNLLPLSQLEEEELAQATQDMQDIRDCYDTLLSAAAAAANTAYEFSESLGELGSCLLEKTALNDDEDSGKVLLMLGKTQFQLQKLIDNYRSHISQTITIPSQSLLNELGIVEEMKRHTDEKRDVYEHILTRYRERGRFRSGKAESFSLQQLQTARDEYDEEATSFIFRLKSLKQGQSWSLLTQAARHHAAQLYFFKKAVRSLETVEPHVQLVTKQQHIDYHFIGLEGEDEDEGDDVDDDDSSDENDNGELSFDYGENEHEEDVSTSQNSFKDNLDMLPRISFSFRDKSRSQSAPLYADNRPDYSGKLRQMQPSLSRKFNSYVLPTPVDTKSSMSSRPSNQVPTKRKTNLNEPTKNLWHSSPLEPKKYGKILGDERFSGPNVRNAQSILQESNSKTVSTTLPPPLIDSILSSNNDFAASYSKKIKIHAFSGPVASNPWLPTKPVSVESVHLFSGPLFRTPIPQPRSSSPTLTSPIPQPRSSSPTLTSSPKISELHELPRPPSNTQSNSKLLGLVGHSGPLVSRGQNLSAANNLVITSAASPLPMPPPAMPRSFSIPSGGTQVAALLGSRPVEGPRKSTVSEDIASPPLMPIDLSGSPRSSNG
ncbi:PREDICTED: uncharacterized protein At2g33490-like [Lupinus angustifolius]|uniref:uncharacterized protein At2g33490-like n=1 Tax=Lupinus angustifolius TaxID=3871 RepID=UPI00092F50EB|nr:PREDICTED: uncharacterized protein At2g33490-like [Lupinus angustifolius]XP_019427248.1 PREDICTED: uncharacterized protein At2g33490-like [Lupinus angustifolius]